jgi:hypothetical protein
MANTHALMLNSGREVGTPPVSMEKQYIDTADLLHVTLHRIANPLSLVGTAEIRP